MFCSTCGIEVPDDSSFCQNCGAPVAQAAPSAVPEPPARRRAWLLATGGGALAVVVAVVVVVLLVVQPFGVGDGEDTIAEAKDIDPAQLVLDESDVPGGFRLTDDEYTDEEEEAEDSCDPDEALERLRSWGWMQRYEKTFEHRSGDEAIFSSATVYRTVEGAREAFNGVLDMAKEELRCSAEQEGLRLEDVRISKDASVGQEAAIIKGEVTGSFGQRAEFVTIGFRRGNIVAAVEWASVAGRVSQDDVRQLVRRQDEIIRAALAGAPAFTDEVIRIETPTETETPTPPESGTAPTGAIDVSSVPELRDGALSVGSDIAYAPFEFYITGTETEDGLDIDLARAIAEALGVEVKFLNTGWDGIIPALQTEDYDVIVSAMTITDERSEQIDFVAYITVGTGIVVPTGNPNNIQSLDDLCGLTVAVQVGTIQVDMLNDQNDQCDTPIEVVTFDTNPLAVEDVRTGGADANLSDFPVAAADASLSGGQLEVVETQIAPEPYGIGIRKESTELKGAIAEALDAIRASDRYDEILADWGLEALALR